MYHIDELKKMHTVMDSGNPDDGWVSARPLPDVFIKRLKDAWQVLLGRADAVRWYRQ